MDKRTLIDKVNSAIQKASTQLDSLLFIEEDGMYGPRKPEDINSEEVYINDTITICNEICAGLLGSLQGICTEVLLDKYFR